MAANKISVVLSMDVSFASSNFNIAFGPKKT
jgi:hypothetical protein